MAKSNKNLYIGIAVAVLIIVAVVVGILVATRGNGGDSGAPQGGEESSTEFANVDETIAFGDYEGMETLSKDIQNGYATGKVVSIDGIVSHPMSTYSVVQENEDGTKKIGTQFIIEGVEDSDYPEDGSRVKITGKVIEKSALYFVIQTNPDNISIVEETE